MTAVRPADLPEAVILAAIHPMDHGGTPTYVIRNRIAQGGRHGAPTAALVRKALNRLESLGRVARTSATRANEVRWEVGPMVSRKRLDALIGEQLARYPVITSHLRD